jgi:dihydrofolate reductase
MTAHPGRLERCIIVAMTPQGVIGKDGKLPWHLPSDLQRFRRLTLGHSVVMGYRTFKEIVERKGKPLEGRDNYVLTRKHKRAVHNLGATPVSGVFEPIGQTWARAQELFIIGGRSAFEEALPHADRFYLTIVDADIRGDVFFPELNMAKWRLVNGIDAVSQKHHPDDEYPSHFLEYERIKTPEGS